MKFECNSCGVVVDVLQSGAEDSASCVGPDEPPNGWRTIWTVIQVSDGDGGMETSAGDVLHSCEDCNAKMPLDDHHAAEFESRKRVMPGVGS